MARGLVKAEHKAMGMGKGRGMEKERGMETGKGRETAMVGRGVKMFRHV